MSQYSKRNFHDIDIKELIRQYRQYECLWNYKSPDYKSKMTKSEAWVEIANYFQKDVNEVKRKIKYLRTAYLLERRKVVSSKRSGRETPYKPSLFYYSELNFLDDIVVHRNAVTDADNTDLQFDNTYMPQDVEDSEFISFGNGENDDKEPVVSCKVEAFVESEQDLPVSPIVRNSPKLVSSQSLNSRPAKRSYSGEIKSKRTGEIKSTIASPVAAKKAEYKNVYISFGKTIALQLQQLPLEMAILAMSEIHAILTKKTLEHIKSLRKGEETSDSEYGDDCNELIEEAFYDSS